MSFTPHHPRIASTSSFPSSSSAASAIFHSLNNAVWNISRTIDSFRPGPGSGRFDGEATFTSRGETTTAPVVAGSMGTASDGGGAVEAEVEGGEIMYEEKGIFVLDGAQEGQGMQASQRYIYRLSANQQSIEIYLHPPKPSAPLVLYALLSFPPLLNDAAASDDTFPRRPQTLTASATHLCTPDTYDVVFEFDLASGDGSETTGGVEVAMVVVRAWRTTTRVKGPRKDYLARAEYWRR